MITQNHIIRLIFGLKIKQLRQKKGLSPADLSKESGLSISYLNEIEKGKKHPKADKIILLAGALGVKYDDLVSLKLSKNLENVSELLNSPLVKEFPLEMFGLEPGKLIEIISNAPVKINVFINTIIEIARKYEMGQEKFYFAALRSYQEMHDNYFEELEKSVDSFIKEHQLDITPPFDRKQLYDILEDRFGYTIDKQRLHTNKDLMRFRSVFIPVSKKLLINNGLTESQKDYLLGREIAFNYLQLKERPYITTFIKAGSFEEVLNNFKASYFAVALLMNRQILIDDIGKLFGSKKWREDAFLNLMNKYDASPEMFLQRLTNLLPKYFGIKNLFFLRFNHTGKSKHYDLTKELHLSRQHNPHGNELNEHYCRRWVSLRIIDELKKNKKTATVPVVGIQRSKYWGTGNEYLCISFAKSNTPAPDAFVSVTIGFLIDDNLKKKIRFLNDPAIVVKWVNETCERCPIEDCRERVSDPVVIERDRQIEMTEKALAKLT